MAVSRIGADDDDNVRMLDAVEVLCAGRGSEGLAEAIACRRMADAGAGIDVVVAESCPHQFLHEERLLVGAARRGDATDRFAAVLILDAPKLAGEVRIGLFPGDFLPRVGDLLADHRVKDTVLVARITKGKTAFDAGMAT